jgi:hypothetical protein
VLVQLLFHQIHRVNTKLKTTKIKRDMEYLLSGKIEFYISMSVNIFFAIVFIYHYIKTETNNSIKILAGCLCLSMAAIHFFIAYRSGLDKSSLLYYHLTVNNYLLLMVLNSVTVIMVFLLHRLLNVRFHYVGYYVYRCIFFSIVLNLSMHIDIIVGGNREANWLWTLYSYGENTLNIIIFSSVLIARKWGEVFKWLQLAHSR